MPETNSHFTPELWICAPGDLTMSNLTYTASLLEFQRANNLVSTKISFIYLLMFRLGSRFAVIGYCPSPCVTSWVLHVSPAFQEFAKQTISCLCRLRRGYPTERSLEQWPPALSLKVFWMKRYSQFYDWWLHTARNWHAEVVLLDPQMYHKCFVILHWSSRKVLVILAIL